MSNESDRRIGFFAIIYCIHRCACVYQQNVLLKTMKIIISIIVTIYNGEKFIDDCFENILNQTLGENIAIEVCVFNDASQDATSELLNLWQIKFRQKNIDLKVSGNEFGRPLGVGYGRNRSIDQSTGTYFCFQDIDDEMFPNRILVQFDLAKDNTNAIIGSRFIRTPSDATCRYATWANNLDSSKLTTQVFTSHGPTVIMPTWFCHRCVYDRVGGFSESGKGTPEDLIFFYKHLDLGGTVLRADQILLNYKYHLNATTFSVDANTIWQIRFERLIETVLNKSPWNNSFSIWNAGKQGRKFFRCLPEHFKNKVVSFCDVDTNKINKNYNYFEEVKRKVNRSIPIVHFTQVQPPIIVCMKLNMTKGSFENNLNSLNMIEGEDYILFT